MAGTKPQRQSVQPTYLDRPVLLEGTLKLLFENSADATLLNDGNVIIGCNQAAVDLMRCSSKAELLSHHFSELSPPFQADGQSSFDKANEMVALAFAKGNHRCEWMCKRADGSQF